MIRISLVRALALTHIALALGCGSDDTSEARYKAGDDRVTYRLQGDITAKEDFFATPGAVSETVGSSSGAWGGSRIGCSVVNVSDAAPSRGKVMLVSAVENYGEEHGSGVYLKISGFVGEGTYSLADGGRAWVFEKGHIQSCAREGDKSCFQGDAGCTVTVRVWNFTPGIAQRPEGYPEAVAVGLAEGTFECSGLSNEVTKQSVSIVSGKFACHAYDWSLIQTE